MNKFNTPRGDGAQSMRALSPSNVRLSYGGRSNGADWFGPLAPMPPVAPPEVAGRSWDFPTGFNLSTQPRANEPIASATLRELADSYDPLRLVIDRRKDQLGRLPWTIRVKHEGRGKRPAAAALAPALRAMLRDISEFFREPAYKISFRQFVRILAEDHFIIDAPACFCRRSCSGELLRLQPVDDALIKRNIDTWGNTPEPFPATWPCIWNGQTVTQENYRSLGFELVNGWLFPPAYSLTLKGGMPAVNYTVRDLIYRPANLTSHSPYGRSPVEHVVTTVNTAVRRAASQLDYFREGNQPEAIYSLPATWTPDQVQRFQDYWDSILSGNLGARRRMKFMAGDGRYVPIKEPPLKSDFDEWLVRIICVAFSYPPNAFMNLSNKSTAEHHERVAEEEGLQTTKLFFSDLLNDIITEEFSDEVEFAWVEEDEIDQVKQAEILTKYAESGILTINQARERIGEEADLDPAASRLMVKTATGYVPIGEAATDSQSTDTN